MPWKESHLMDERVRFVSRLLEGERMMDLCSEFGISRKTGHKFYRRYVAQGVRGLLDESRRPAFHPHHTPQAIEKLIVDLREVKPTWGPKKLKTRLETLHPGVKMPAASTIGEILRRYGMPLRKRRLRRRAYYPTLLSRSEAPNEVWCVDFKGEFRLGNHRYCYPLTVSDHYSRYFLGCEALEDTKIRGVMSSFENIFSEYGLPQVIRSDNGPPFAAKGLNGWNRLAVWWMRLGIALEKIEPGHPEQNGRHERLHCTLKYEATRPASENLLQQQERFDLFREEYNNQRPHEALDMRTPSSVHTVSERKYPLVLETIKYLNHDCIGKVESSGMVGVYGKVRFYLSIALAGEEVGFREIEPGVWLVSFMNHDLGYFHEKTQEFVQETPYPLKGGSIEMSPMFPV